MRFLCFQIVKRILDFYRIACSNCGAYFRFLSYSFYQRNICEVYFKVTEKNIGKKTWSIFQFFFLFWRILQPKWNWEIYYSFFSKIFWKKWILYNPPSNEHFTKISCFRPNAPRNHQKNASKISESHTMTHPIFKKSVIILIKLRS